MKKRSNIWWGVAIGFVIFLIACIASIFIYLYSSTRTSDFQSRPLVLIQNPLNRDQVNVGELVLLQASAREEMGLSKLEIWVDDVLIGERFAAEASSPTNLFYSGSWIPVTEGNHIIIAKAVSSKGKAGQSTVVITARDVGSAAAETYTASQGDTLDSIASDFGVSPEQIEEENPGIGSGGIAPGDELTIPDGEPAGEAPALPEGGGDSPAPEGEPPGGGGFFDLGILYAYRFGEDEPLGLRIEMLDLETSSPYESLHCYLGIGGQTPAWFPDMDDDQSTDESFEPISMGPEGYTGWNISEYLSGNYAPVMFWDQNLPIELDLSCVGITADGTDAVDLGNLRASSTAEEWNGVPRSLAIPGDNPAYSVTYRISHVGDTPRGIPLWLDNSMTPPTNARILETPSQIRWDYTPAEGEEPIDGFRVYLNGNLQWVETADSRRSFLPPEWLRPPCGSPYTFIITAFRVGFPDGPESRPAVAIVETSPEDCNKQIQIEFQQLETFDLGTDGNQPRHHGDIGPVWGVFNANSDAVSFDTRSPGSGGSLDMANGLGNNQTYNLDSMSDDVTWHFSGLPQLVVDVPVGGIFEYGFQIFDQDSGHCHDSDDSGCPDTICDAMSFQYQDNPVSGELDELHENTLTSNNGRCRVTVRWEPTADSPRGSGVAGYEPRPWINVDHISVDETTGMVVVDISNGGTGTWANRDLTIELRTRNGASLGYFTWSNFTLAPGDTTQLEREGLEVHTDQMDACIWIDPYDDVLEEYEQTGALFHGPVCSNRPDLTISSVSHDFESGITLAIVRNSGEGELEGRTIQIHKNSNPISDGRYELAGTIDEVTLLPGETIEIPISIDGTSRIPGYDLIVDQLDRISETDESNNSISIGAMGTYLIGWEMIEVPYDYRNDTEFRFRAAIVSGPSRREVASWNINQEIDWGSCFSPRYCVLSLNDPDTGNLIYGTPQFELYGEETLVVTVTATETNHGDVTGEETYTNEENYGAGPMGPSGACHNIAADGPSAHLWVMGTEFEHDAQWLTQFSICEVP